MPSIETPLEQAGRNLREAQNRVVELQGTLACLERSGSAEDVALAEEAVARSLLFHTLADEQLRLETARCGADGYAAFIARGL